MTYQGRLTDGVAAATGGYDFRLILYNSDVGGSQVGATITNLNVAVDEGVFTLVIDFGAVPFDGNPRWLELSVRTNGGGAFARLDPRQAVSAAPYAVTAGSVTGKITDAQLSANVVRLNTGPAFSGGVTAPSFTGSGSGLSNLNASVFSTGTMSDARLGANVARTNQVWLLGGNAGTAGTQFLGTTDSQPLDLRANNLRGLRLHQTATNSGFINYSGVNVIGGYPGNTIPEGVVGATIAGGGYRWLLTDVTNQVVGNYGTVGGGFGNTAGHTATVPGGGENSALGKGSFAAGRQAAVTHDGSFLWSDGQQDAASTAANRFDVYAAGGASFFTTGGFTVRNPTNNTGSLRIGGEAATGEPKMLRFGDGDFVHIGENGQDDTMELRASRFYFQNGYLGIGITNPSTPLDVYGGTTLRGTFTVRDGTANTVMTVIPAVQKLSITATGGVHLAQGTPLVLEGSANVTGSQLHMGAARIGGSVIPIGTGSAILSFDLRDTAMSLTQDLGAGDASLTVNGRVTATSFNPSSDRALKENIAPVDPRVVLEKVAALPIAEWNFKSTPAELHIGPMAQDFHSVFQTGPDDRHISTVDADGVALAAIQGLNQKVDAEKESLRLELRARDTELQALKERVAALEKCLSSASR